MSGLLPVDLISVNAELTLACNLRCLHCGSTAGRPRPAELTTAEYRRVIRDLRELGCREVCLLGGEPFVRRDWHDVARAVGDAGMDLVLITNGMLVTPALVESLLDLPRLNRIGVSLDGASPEIHDRIRGRPGAFRRARRALFLLRDAGIETGAITTVSRYNFRDLPRLCDLLANENLTWQIQVASVHGGRFDASQALSPREYYDVGRFIARCRRDWDVDDLPVAGAHGVGYHSTVFGSVGELPQWHGCAGGLATLGLTSDGGIKPCLSQPDDRIVGNVRTRSLREIWNDPRAFRRTRRFRIDMLSGFCRTCPHARSCRAGCPDMALGAGGTDSDNPYCFYRLEAEGTVDSATAGRRSPPRAESRRAKRVGGRGGAAP